MKKLFSLLLALTLVFALGAGALAADTTITETSVDKSGSMTVNYEVIETYTVTIPESVTLGTAPVNGTIGVDITHLRDGYHIDAAITASNGVLSGDGAAFEVKLNTDANQTLPYSVKSSNDGETYNDYAMGGYVGGVNGTGGWIWFQYALGDTGNAPAGAYSGTVTFSIVVNADTP